MGASTRRASFYNRKKISQITDQRRKSTQNKRLNQTVRCGGFQLRWLDFYTRRMQSARSQNFPKHLRSNRTLQSHTQSTTFDGHQWTKSLLLPNGF